MKRYKKMILAAGVIMITLSLLGIGIAFIKQSSKGLYQEKLNYLSEISKKSADNIYEQINNSLSTMDTIATFVGEQSNDKLEQVLPMLAKEIANDSFQRIGVITPEGKATSVDYFVYDFSESDCFKQAMKGKSVVSDHFINEINQQEISVFASPIYKGKDIIGVLFGTKSQEQLSQFINIEIFHGEGYSYIIKRNGQPVIKSSHKNSIHNFDNIFDVVCSYGVSQKDRLRLENDIQNDRTGSFEYIRDGIKRQLCYTKINVNDWYLISVVPSNIISHQSNHLIVKMTIMTVVIIILIGVGSLIIIFSLSYNKKKLEQIAYTDEVTGYSNIQKFNIDVKQILKNHQENRFAMIIFDVNQFKLINDMFGYEMGNHVLNHIAEVISRNQINGETFSHSTADIFHLLMIYTSDQQILERVDKIAKEIQGYIEGNTIEIAVGIYVIVDPTLEINVINEQANISRGIAKKQSIIKYHFFKEEDRLAILQEKEIENKMEKSLENGEFQVYLQPQYSIGTNKIIGAEALTYWVRSQNNILSPNDFMPLFEKNGFIRQLDFYVFEQICKISSEWDMESTKLSTVPISMNISKAHLSNKEWIQQLSKIAKNYHVKPQMIGIELTESAVFGNVQMMMDIIKKIKDLKFSISIDSFGSGYSALSTIKDLPADYVKINKSFLDESIKDIKGKQILCGIIEMCEKLNISVIAEGVETKQQIEILTEAGCNIIQGYYSKPILVKEFEKLITKEPSI
ncbi:MAG: EAL domain-containing protein [Lachnospiraceae bacterium]